MIIIYQNGSGDNKEEKPQPQMQFSAIIRTHFIRGGFLLFCSEGDTVNIF